MGKKMEKGVRVVVNKPVLQKLLKRHKENFCQEGERASLENLWNHIRKKYNVETSYKALAHYTSKNPSEWKLTYAALIVNELESSFSELFILQEVSEDGRLKYDVIKERQDDVDTIKFGKYDNRSLSARLYAPKAD